MSYADAVDVNPGPHTGLTSGEELCRLRRGGGRGLPAPLGEIEVSQLERIREEKDDVRRGKHGCSPAARKAFWIHYAETKRRKARIREYYLAWWRQKTQKG